MWQTDVYGPKAWTSVPPEFKAAAESGAMLALAEVSQPLEVTVTTIGFNNVDTTPDDVKLATAHAVWQATGHAPASPPYIDADGLHFPTALPSPSAGGCKLAAAGLLITGTLRGRGRGAGRSRRRGG
jgi:hypothetical protein